MLARLILLTVIWLTACTPTLEQASDPAPLPTQTLNISSALETAVPEIRSSPGGGQTVTPRELVEKAKADLIQRYDVNAEQIRITESRAVTWPDASLGCPQPNLAYVQVQTPGFWILLEADGKQYPYHTDEADQLILCLRDFSDMEGETPLPVLPADPDEIDDGEPWVPVN